MGTLQNIISRTVASDVFLVGQPLVGENLMWIFPPSP